MKKQSEPKSMSKADKEEDEDHVLHDLTVQTSEDSIDKLLDVLADIDLVEDFGIKKRIKKICYAIIRGIERSDCEVR